MDVEELKKIEGVQSPMKKTIKGAAVGLIVGILGVISFPNRYFVPLPPGVKRSALPVLMRTLKLVGKDGATGAAVVGIFEGVVQGMEKYQKKTDAVKGAVAGFVAGATVVGFHLRSISEALRAGGVFGLGCCLVYPVVCKIADEGKQQYVCTRDKKA